jgi:hypothetical protein
VDEAIRKNLGVAEVAADLDEVDVGAGTGAGATEHLRYRPRRPKFMNRVRTGYDWHQYNRTHFDRDTPPPRVVQGYQFNITYSELLDPSQTPTYRIEPADSPEFCIIRFHAGPPYEDVAFKIVNKEWDKHPRAGFRREFRNGVLHLWFNFMRSFYKR